MNYNSFLFLLLVSTFVVGAQVTDIYETTSYFVLDETGERRKVNEPVSLKFTDVDEFNSKLFFSSGIRKETYFLEVQNSNSSSDKEIYYYACDQKYGLGDGCIQVTITKFPTGNSRFRIHGSSGSTRLIEANSGSWEISGSVAASDNPLQRSIIEDTSQQVKGNLYGSGFLGLLGLSADSKRYEIVATRYRLKTDRFGKTTSVIKGFSTELRNRNTVLIHFDEEFQENLPLGISWNNSLEQTRKNLQKIEGIGAFDLISIAGAECLVFSFFLNDELVTGRYSISHIDDGSEVLFYYENAY